MPAQNTPIQNPQSNNSQDPEIGEALRKIEKDRTLRRGGFIAVVVTGTLVMALLTYLSYTTTPESAHADEIGAAATDPTQ